MFWDKKVEFKPNTALITQMTLAREETADLHTTDPVKLAERDSIRHIRLILEQREKQREAAR